MRYHLTNVRACLYSTESHFRDSAMASTSAGSFMLYAVSCIHVVLLAPLQFRSLAHACIHTLVPSERVSYHYNVLLSCRSGKFEYVTVSIRDRQYSPLSCVAHLSNYKQRSVLEHCGGIWSRWLLGRRKIFSRWRWWRKSARRASPTPSSRSEKRRWTWPRGAPRRQGRRGRLA